jgi:acetyl-CoA carboxylase biotin carboxyl carrier protein
LHAFEQGDWDEIHLVTEDIEVHVSAPTGDPGVTHLWDKSAPEGRPAGVAADPADSSSSTAGIASAVDRRSTTGTTTAATAPSADGQLDEVVAPSPGIFWRSPSPGAPPFADVGDHVGPDSTMCIVEVMKLMNHVTAQVMGTVVEVLVGNGEQVERGQALFRVRPEGA